MTESHCSNRNPEIDVFAPKAEAAWKALRGRFASKISDAEIDHFYAVFIYGLTAPSFDDDEPSAHLDICRALLELNVPPERAHDALHAIPVSKEPWVASAYKTMEHRGTEMGREIAEQIRTGEVRASNGAEVRQATPAEFKENLP
ncbi:hypothetical protein [Chelativorans sp. YIM 93263]|uniref:hypothetical protein n=1 Tax=Chelativorans sp. YIM 93263 TaxID=2906648 RepID=UPI002379E56F|nr:hypothetical protein [Chelativorans sp. YIM 93263]